MTTPDQTPQPPVLADNLPPTARNLASAARAVDKLTETAWRPLAGYPGSDTLWSVRCLLCIWEGPRFYSHLRRERPAFRHPGCLPTAQIPKALASYQATLQN